MKRAKKTDEVPKPNQIPVPQEPTSQPIPLNSGQKPVVPPAFPKPPLTTPFPQGTKIRQDNRSRFFSRTRRGI